MVPWLLNEMAELDLGDARLDRRAMKVLQAMSLTPGASLPRVCGTHADLIGAYRLFDNESVTLEQMLAGHRAATLKRAEGETVVLAIQDSTWLDYGTHRGCEGLGAHTHGREHGMLLHLSLLVNGHGSILGSLEAPTLLHGRLPAGTAPRRQRPREQRQSHRWVQAHQLAMREAAAQPHVTWISVQDREGDLYPLFAQPRPANGHWLVRMHHDRRACACDDQDTIRLLSEQLAATPACGTMQVPVPAQPGRPARTATLQLHVRRVCLQPPRAKAGERRSAALPPVEVTLVRAHECAPPAGQPPIDWWLLTSLPVADVAAAEQVVRWYHQRWRIEEFFRVLKSETAVQKLQLGTRRRLEAALGLHLILAWRICSLRDQSRAHPDASCETMFTAAEWQAICLLATDQVAAEPPSLAKAVALLARLGGYLGRKRDGPPGHRTIAHGLRALHAALRLAEKLHATRTTLDV